MIVVLGIWSLVMVALIAAAWVLTAWRDTRRRAIHWLSLVCGRGYFWLVPGWRVEVEGEVPEGTFVIVANHRSMLDIALIHCLPMHGQFKWVSKREVYKWPVFGWALWMRGDVGIERGSARGVRQMLREGGGWLRRGVSIVVFPEGTRRKEKGLGKFHDGAFMLAREAGVKILPVVLGGTDTARVGRRHVFTIKILPPMEADAEQVRRVMSYE